MTRKADMHVHTKYSNLRNTHPDTKPSEKGNIDNINEPEALFKKAKKIGLDAIAITDHDSIYVYEEAEFYSKKYGVGFIRGLEISSAEGDILAYGIHQEIPKYMPANETVGLIHEQGGIAVIAHPFPINRYGKKIRPGMGVSDKIILETDFDGIEVFDHFLGRSKNALAMAEKKAIAHVSGTDAHFIYDLGRIVTLFETEGDKEEHYLKAIKERKTQVVGKKINVIKAAVILPYVVMKGKRLGYSGANGWN